MNDNIKPNYPMRHGLSDARRAMAKVIANENETVANIHDDMLQVVADEFGNVTMAQSDFVDYALRFVAANNRELSKKDAEIADLKDKNTEAFKAVLKRDALIRDLADALKKIDDACDGDMCKHFIDTEQCSKCKYLETCQTGIAHSALKTNESEIAKALEVCK